MDKHHHGDGVSKVGSNGRNLHYICDEREARVFPHREDSHDTDHGIRCDIHAPCSGGLVHDGHCHLHGHTGGCHHGTHAGYKAGDTLHDTHVLVAHTPYLNVVSDCGQNTAPHHCTASAQVAGRDNVPVHDAPGQAAGHTAAVSQAVGHIVAG